MKNIVYIVIAAVCLLSVVGCAKKAEGRQDKFEVYGNIVSGLDTMTRCDVVEIFGSPDTSIRYDYPQCYDGKGRRILPLHNRYLNHLGKNFTLSIWHNIDNTGEDLMVYFQMHLFSSENRYDSAFWAIRCAPEEVDSVLSLYTAE